MSDKSHGKWHRNRLKRGEQVGGGCFVFARGSTTGRIKVNPQNLPFEHGTDEAVMAEAKRLASKNPGVRFSIFKEVGSVLVPKPEGEA